MSKRRDIPFFNYSALFKAREDEYMEVLHDVLSRGAYIMQSDLEDFEENLADFLGVKHVLGVADGTNAVVLPKITLNDLAYLLQNAQAVVGSDTGLSHVAAALDTRTIAMYGPTSVALTGLVGCDVHNLQSTKNCSPCLKRDCPLIQSENDIIPCYESLGVEKIMGLLDLNGSL